MKRKEQNETNVNAAWSLEEMHYCNAEQRLH